jgi:hypothetical protein
MRTEFLKTVATPEKVERKSNIRPKQSDSLPRHSSYKTQEVEKKGIRKLKKHTCLVEKEEVVMEGSIN